MKIAAVFVLACILGSCVGAPSGDLEPLPRLVDRVPVTLILADNLTIRAIVNADRKHFPNLPRDWPVALVSPGLARNSDPNANLYATLTAGDVANVRNPNNGLLDRLASEPANLGRLRILRLGDTSDVRGLQRLDSAISRASIDATSKVIVCGVVPPHKGKWWNTLSPLFIHFVPTQVSIELPVDLSSDTTHTLELVAMRDIAPTALNWAGIRVPESMSGSPIGWTWEWESLRLPSLIPKLQSLTQLNDEILLWMAWTYGIISGLAVIGSLAGVLGYLPRQRQGIRYLVRYLFACPVALMLAPLPLWFGWLPMTLPVYGLLTALIPAAIALLSVRRICLLTSLVLIADGFTGTHMVAMSSLSGYWLSGIRFYGIGNEYMGVLVGFGLVASLKFVGEENTPMPKGVAWRLALWYAVIVFVLSFPAFGAKAGGAIVSLAAFIPAWLALDAPKPTSLAGVRLVYAGLDLLWFSCGRLSRTTLECGIRTFRRRLLPPRTATSGIFGTLRSAKPNSRCARCSRLASSRLWSQQSPWSGSGIKRR